jgi:hypothetical protein
MREVWSPGRSFSKLLSELRKSAIQVMIDKLPDSLEENLQGISAEIASLQANANKLRYLQN